MGMQALARAKTLGFLSGAVGACATFLELVVQYGYGVYKLESGSALAQIRLIAVTTLVAVSGALAPAGRVQSLVLVVACAGFFIDGFLNMALSPVLILAAALAGMAAEKGDQAERLVLGKKG